MPPTALLGEVKSAVAACSTLSWPDGTPHHERCEVLRIRLVRYLRAAFVMIEHLDAEGIATQATTEIAARVRLGQRMHKTASDVQSAVQDAALNLLECRGLRGCPAAACCWAAQRCPSWSSIFDFPSADDDEDTIRQAFSGAVDAGQLTRALRELYGRGSAATREEQLEYLSVHTFLDLVDRRGRGLVRFSDVATALKPRAARLGQDIDAGGVKRAVLRFTIRASEQSPESAA